MFLVRGGREQADISTAASPHEWLGYVLEFAAAR